MLPVVKEWGLGDEMSGQSFPSLPISLISVDPLSSMSVTDNIQKYVLSMRTDKYQSVCILSAL